ncbi:hypothetical protein AMECASPLE_038542 [Ameca splendens]|uniref:Uncharacterized protein n=1 Tax=Ameca splendens TaxID=208324 RepID=A0ABV1AFG6_9TELE
MGVIKVQALPDFPSEVYKSKLCSREFPAETLTLQRRVEQFPRSEGRTTGPHHRGYSCNVQFGRATQRATPQLRRLAAVKPWFTVEAFFKLHPQKTFPQHGSRKRLGLDREK